ncbi:MAG: 50S ribosomal protein L22 [Candidatus Liptonbacteria bacterium RIFCSPLOWO2_01_FULL_53_13]|uniref:50S ribosomal protein L22 n=1 Tax=Candidatus Liptonbacteria bacterium RIFCSPLOWO2_01_FULL_53_13 TaxID=1798651 RepID=A0A1G2CL06_9BACT|nr:MAG: 50S ribosomal protein L22 [Candidatus Liptonbacteria bacterium RIFCSPLOWO2_01_FULL_53_13]
MAPRKVRAIADIMRGLSANEAEAQLLLMPRRAAKPLLKLLRSATAGAKQRNIANAEDLVIEKITVDGASMLKRSLPRARGSASPIQRKMSHVTLILGAPKAEAKRRFTIVVKKKSKLPPEETKVKKKKQSVKEEDTKGRERKAGFFRRMFARKSI